MSHAAAPRRGAAVLGSPVEHSLSPVLHMAAYDALGLSDWHYRAIECDETDLEATLRALDDEGVAGASLTMPLKRAVMAMLAAADELATVVGAANTVLFAGGGEWAGWNTDVPGMVAALRSAGGLDASTGASPWVLGAGATAGSALAALAALGYADAIVVARRPEATGELRLVADRAGMSIEVRPWAEVARSLAAPVVVSTAPAGATDALAAQLGSVSGLLFDVVYSPWPTRLASAWARGGGEVVGGLELLVEQAVEQVRLMTGRTPPAQEMRRAGYAALGRA